MWMNAGRADPCAELVNDGSESLHESVPVKGINTYIITFLATYTLNPRVTYFIT